MIAFLMYAVVLLERNLLFISGEKNKNPHNQYRGYGDYSNIKPYRYTLFICFVDFQCTLWVKHLFLF